MTARVGLDSCRFRAWFCDGDGVGALGGRLDGYGVAVRGHALALGQEGVVGDLPVAGVAGYFEGEFAIAKSGVDGVNQDAFLQ